MNDVLKAVMDVISNALEEAEWRETHLPKEFNDKNLHAKSYDGSARRWTFLVVSYEVDGKKHFIGTAMGSHFGLVKLPDDLAKRAVELAELRAAKG